MVIQITVDDAMIAQLNLRDPNAYLSNVVMQQLRQDLYAVQINTAAQQVQTDVAAAVTSGVSVDVQVSVDPQVMQQAQGQVSL